MNRVAEVKRDTKETSIHIDLDIDNGGDVRVKTGIPFFDHMLELMFKHAVTTLVLDARGDLEVDAHHTVEDVGLALGSALDRALGDRTGINRFGSSLVPMDDALSEVALDISGRPYLDYEADVPREPVESFDPALAVDFFRALVNESKITLHVMLRKPGGAHHSLEAIFKGVGRALGEAVRLDPQRGDVPSTKGTL